MFVEVCEFSVRQQDLLQIRAGLGSLEVRPQSLVNELQTLVDIVVQVRWYLPLEIVELQLPFELVVLLRTCLFELALPWVLVLEEVVDVAGEAEELFVGDGHHVQRELDAGDRHALDPKHDVAFLHFAPSDEAKRFVLQRPWDRDIPLHRGYRFIDICL